MITHNDVESPEGQWPPSGMIQCPKEDCARLFTSRKVLEAHQMTYPSHAFCRECNIQFRTHEELFLHHLVSKRHHNCPICNCVFNSESGRDYHIRTNHPEERGLICPGCRMKFSSSKSYTAHIVYNACKTAAVRSLNKHNERREKMEQLLFHASHGEHISSPAELILSPTKLVSSPTELTVTVYSDDDNYRDGGNDDDYLGLPPPRYVPRQDDDNGRDEESDDDYLGLPPPRYVKRQQNARTDHPKNGHGSKGTNSPESDNSSTPGLSGPATESLSSSNRSSNPSNPPISNIPAPNTPWSPSDLLISPDDLIAWEDDLDDGNWFSSPSKYPMPNSNQTRGPPPLLKLFPQWDSEEHWNSETKRYFCECGFTSPFVKVFEQHVVMENTQNESNCSHCGKKFKSMSALLAHVEAYHAKSNMSQKGNQKGLLKCSQFAERRLDMDGPNEKGDLEFQIYDRPPAYARTESERPRPKLDYGLRSSKVPRGTYW